MKVNWELMEKIFRNINPKFFKKSIYWDFKDYELKHLNQGKEINNHFDYWEIKEEFDLHSVFFNDLHKLKEWITEKEIEYEGQEIRLESYVRYTRYPETEEVFCLISKVQENSRCTEKRFKIYTEEIKKLEQSEIEKNNQKEEKEKKELLRLKLKYDKEPG